MFAVAIIAMIGRDNRRTKTIEKIDDTMNENPVRLRKRSVTLAGHATSVSLEDAFWQELTAIAKRRGLSLNHLIAEIDRERAGNLSSAIRVYVLKHKN